MDRDSSAANDGARSRGQAATRPLRWFLLALAAACLLLVVAVVATRLSGPSAEQREAMRVLEQAAAPVQGRDGSDAFWLLDRDVPAAQRAAVAAATRQYLDRTHGGPPGRGAATDPREAFAKFANAADEPASCDLARPGCLAHVRRDPSAVAAMLARHAGQLRAAQDVLPYDGLRYGVVPTISQPFPPIASGRRLAFTALADRFARGEQAEAIAGTCEEIAAWRRLGADNDLLVAAMVGATFARRHLQLLSEMLAEYPVDAPLPGACTDALAPTRPAELDVCPAMRTEFAWSVDAMRGARRPGAQSGGDRFVAWALDEDHYTALVAANLARFCQAPVRELAANDQSVKLPSRPAGCGRLEWVADPIGCRLADASLTNDYYAYVDARTDLAAALALMRTRIWLRERSPDPAGWPALLPRRPSSLGLRRDAAISDDGAWLEMPLLRADRDTDAFALALVPMPAPDPDPRN